MVALMRFFAIFSIACGLVSEEDLEEGSAGFDDLFLLQQGVGQQRVELNPAGEQKNVKWDSRTPADAVNMMHGQFDTAGEVAKRAQQANSMDVKDLSSGPIYTCSYDVGDRVSLQYYSDSLGTVISGSGSNFGTTGRWRTHYEIVTDDGITHHDVPCSSITSWSERCEISGQEWTDRNGASCDNLGYCKQGAFLPGQEWAYGSANNYPEKNCCVCGKKFYKESAQPEWQRGCSDTQGWENPYGADCAYYAGAGWADGSDKNIWCKHGAVVEGWTVGSSFNHPERNCCVCGKKYN